MAGIADPVRSLGAAPLGLTGDRTAVVREAGGLRWVADARYADRILGPQGDAWLCRVREGQARIVKKGPHRVVYRVEDDDLVYYVKHNLAPDWQTLVRHWLRPSKAFSEFRRLKEVAARGIGTVEPLAFAEPRRRFGNGESILVTRALENVEPLDVFLSDTYRRLPRGLQSRVRMNLAESLGSWVAHLHRAGIRHDDFHAGNILVRLAEEGRIDLFLVDLNAVRVGKALSWNASRDNLVILNRWFSLRASRADRLRFWRTYYAERFQGAQADLPAPERADRMALDLERLTLTSNLVFWKRRDRRCLQNNRYYRRVRGPGVVGHVVNDLDAATVQALKNDPDAPFRHPEVPLLKDSRSTTVTELDILVGGVPRRVIYKRFRLTSAVDPLESLVRRPPALRSWIFGQGFCERGLPTARPLAVFHRTRLGLMQEGYLITERIDNAQNLLQFLQDAAHLEPGERAKQIRRKIRQVAQVLRELHRRRLTHRDLKAHNVLVSKAPRELTGVGSSASLGLMPTAPSDIWIIDLVGVELHRRLRWARKIQNLARLNVSFFAHPSLSRTDKLRFLRDYLQWNLVGKGRWKTWWRAVEQATWAKVARNRRRGRPLH